MSNEKKYQIALSLIPGVGDVIGKKLVAYCGSAEAVFSEGSKTLNKIPGIGSKLGEIIGQADTLDRAEQELEFMEKEGVEMLFYTDKDYPNRLKQCNDSPLTLYYKGNPNFNANKIISIVGTRNASNDRKLFCEKIVGSLTDFNVVVVSGLAYGIDVCAHKAALKNDLETWGVLAHGLDRIYPSANNNVAKEMLKKGSLISDYTSKTNPNRQNFPSRNRIVAGLSDATIVIESGKKGGSLITADIANSYNREVFAVPGNPTNNNAKGCNELIKNQKATLLESIDDIIRELNWDLPENKSKQTQLNIKLTNEERRLVNILEEKMHIDAIASEINWSFTKVSQILLQLEFSGVIQSLPGKIYKRVE